MGLATGNEPLTSLHSYAHDPSQTSLPADEIQKRLPAPPDAPPRQDYPALAARATNDAVRDLDLVIGKLSWPQGLFSLLGYDPTATTANTATIGFWNENVHPDDRSRIATSIRDALAGDTNVWSGEYRFRHASGAYLHLLERAAIVRGENNRAIRLVGSLMDVTARKQLQDQLCRSQKMEAFGQLAAGAAHDFSNFLTTILGYSDLVLSEPGVKGLIANHVGEIRKAAGRASDLTGQLLAFSRKQTLEPRVLDVNSFAGNLERSVLRLLGDHITVVCRLHPEKDGVHIKVDPEQLTQIVLNLAVNARDAMPNGGRLTLETRVATLSEDRVSPPDLDLSPGDYVVIGVIDNGTGMSDEAKAHLFEPFFTTKHDGVSAGLGLATSYGIVQQSGGRIRVESKSGQGTRVEIYLPKVAAPPPSSYKKPGSRKLPTGTETILLLEDDVSVRHMSVRLLRKLGYEVIEAAIAEDAQQLVRSRRDKIDLLVTDMIMPQMSGRRFADWLRSANPHIKVVFVSGYLEESLHPGDRRDPDMFFLPKPFDPEELAQTIRRALDS